MKSNNDNPNFEEDVRFVIKNRDTYEFVDKLNDIHQDKSKPKNSFLFNTYFKYGVAALIILGLGLSVFVLIRQSRKPVYEKVFDQYYAAYQYVNYRGADDESGKLLTKGADFVNDENYEAALEVANRILLKNPNNIEARFLFAVSLLGMEKFHWALEQFDKLAKSDKRYFREYAEWYKALLFLKYNRIDEAVFVLDSIKFEKGPFAIKAAEILKILHSI
ncbi:MAG: hypothetical protein U5Q03_02800 [Bacteroidota bacterium]|nr:hypothetical protein [Bacteroidota bacterium]